MFFNKKKYIKKIEQELKKYGPEKLKELIHNNKEEMDFKDVLLAKQYKKYPNRSLKTIKAIILYEISEELTLTGDGFNRFFSSSGYKKENYEGGKTFLSIFLPLITTLIGGIIGYYLK